MSQVHDTILEMLELLVETSTEVEDGQEGLFHEHMEDIATRIIETVREHDNG